MDVQARRRADLSRKRWNAALARMVLDEFSASGMSLTAFARTLGVNLQRLWWWRKRLAETKQAAAVTFVPAVVSRQGTSTIVRLPGGVEVETTNVAAVSPRWVAELARALTGAP